MSKFKAVCPEELQHYEIGYKPREAIRAGISKKEIQGKYNKLDLLDLL